MGKHKRGKHTMPYFPKKRLALACLMIGLTPPGFADNAIALTEARKAELLKQREAIDAELRKLGQAVPASQPEAVGKPVKSAKTESNSRTLEAIEVAETRETISPRDSGQTVTTIDAAETKSTVGFSITEVLQSSPGITARQGNGPRDVNISIRGSGARQTFAFRNLKAYDDGFPFTEPDGLSRTDIIDPHAYGDIDVVRGPSSALYNNYATGGAINFHTRRGRDINGVEVATDFGSFGYQNYYTTIGGTNDSGSLEYTLFGSHVRGNGFISNSGYNTTTENFLVNYAPDSLNRFSFKFINNDLNAKVPNRLTLNQFNANPFSSGLVTINGRSVSAEQANQNREDRRTIVGLRWERQLDDTTLWTTRGQYSLRDINQQFATVGDSQIPSFDFDTGVTRSGHLFGLPAKHHAGAFYNYSETEGVTVNNFRQISASSFIIGERGQVTAETRGNHSNIGFRAREEVEIGDVTAVIGGGVEHSNIEATVRNGLTSANQPSPINVDNQFFNGAGEAGLTWHANNQLNLRTRIGSGYGIPGIGQLTTATNGLPGNNTALQTQENYNIDVGFDWFPTSKFNLGVTGFYEFFRNEFIAQSPGAGLASFTDNIPESEHRGFEVELDWRFLPDWKFKAAYTLNDQVYINYTESLRPNVGSSPLLRDRSGNKIPGVEPHFVNARVSYDRSSGPLAGFGGFFEFNWVDDYFINNANSLQAPGFNIFNANLHYDRKINGTFFKGFSAFFEVQNIFDDTYVTSANVIATQLVTGTNIEQNAAQLAGNSNSAAFFAGAPRSFFGGIRLKF
ncbi:MAG: TonB-dependent receptor [Methylobacter sp.]|nr:MAG: TonB-dependent receptor [Methylobacter sp.]